MNLTTDPWIPAIRPDGSRALFSLQDLFAQADQLRDLAAKPHERIALMRLLICITQAALDGPADEDAWAGCEPRIQSAVHDYLTRHTASFELFGDGPRFLQVPGLLPAKIDTEGNAATKLDLALASGNNSTLFDNDAGSDRSVPPDRAALNLLTFQCFSPGGTIGVAQWQRRETPGGGFSKHAPCTPKSMIHTLILGPCLLNIIHRNLLTRELVLDDYPAGWGKPLWELPVESATAAGAIANATTTYLGRLLPIPRAIRIDQAGRSMVLANGLSYASFPPFREATATIIQRKEEFDLLPASTARSLWRQLSPITVRRRAGTDQQAGPLALKHPLPGDSIGLWIGAVVMDKKKAGKILDVVEGTYTIPSTLFTEFGRLAYEAGVKHAEEVEGALIKTVREWADDLKIDKPPTDRAGYYFWTAVEQSLASLFQAARDMTPPDRFPLSPWGLAVRKAALGAYDHACPHQTARQSQTYTKGLQILHAAFKPKNSNTTK